MKRPIVKHPDARLRDVAKPVEAVTPEIVALVDDMLETMRAADGVGLAAPQVGVSLRVFVLDKPLGVFINPEIVDRKGTPTARGYTEGCLSVPSQLL